MTEPVFIIIDGHAVAYRQYYALKSSDFKTSGGEVTYAVFGFARTLLDILDKDKPRYLAVSFDMGLSGRDLLYEQYKGTREKMPDDMEQQIPRIFDLVKAFNIPVLALEGIEADDIIGTVAPQAEARGVDVRIVTGDRDLLQLLTPRITVQLPDRKPGGGTDMIWDEAMFRDHYRLEPHQLIDLKALMGDSSDNIPGVAGIGEVGATNLLRQYGTLDRIYEHIDEVKNPARQRLIDGKQMAYLSQQLAAIKRDVPIQLDLDACVAHDFDVHVVEELFRQLEFRTLAKRLGKLVEGANSEGEASDSEFSPPEEQELNVETEIVRDQAALDRLVDTLKNAKAIVWDVETTGIDQMAARLVGIALAVDGAVGYYIPVGHVASGDLFDEPVQQLPLESVIDALRGPMTDPKIAKYAHNAAYDLVVTQRYGIDVAPVTFDTMLAEWVRDPTSKFMGLKNFAFQFLKVRMQNIDELIGTGKKQITMDRVPVERAAPYAAADAAITYRAVEILRPKLEAEPALLNLFNTLEMPFVPVLTAVERAGVLLDTDHLAQLSVQLAQSLADLERLIFGMTGEFNLNSPKQLSDLLFGKLGLSVEGVRKTQTGYATDAATLENLRETHPSIPMILNHRELSKLKSTYADALPALINPETGRLHTDYSQTGTATGRLSSSNPNLQNIPIRTELGREVRRAFIAPPGCQLISADYSQIELRVLAHYSEDPTLLEAFHQYQDIHAATAAAVYGVPIDSVTFEQRSFAKRVNFGLIYGMGAYRLARDSDLSVTQARDFIETYFSRLPRVKQYLDETKQRAREGPITTLFGRSRVFPLLQNAERSNPNLVQGEERVAINMPIQGSAADILKKAMIDLHHELQRRKLQARMILQVHDELVLEAPEAEVGETQSLIVEVMENAYPLKAPLRANASVGPNWRDMEPIVRL